MIKLIALQDIADTEDEFNFALTGQVFEVSSKERADYIIKKGYAKFESTDKGNKPVIPNEPK